MKTRLTIAALAALSCIVWAAEDAAVDRQSIVHSPSSIVEGVDAVTIPRMLSYQGKLTDDLGNPVSDTTYSVAFRLYTVPSGGSAFWSETQTVRTRSGLFSVLLGSVTPIGSMPDAGAVYLGMAVAGGAELTPRLRIASAAYAFLTERAANADLLQGRDTTTFSRSGHNHDAAYVNEGQVDAVTGAMMVNGTVQTVDVADTAVTMAKLAQAGASTGQVVKWTGSAWAPGPDNTGGGAGVTNVYEDTGITCVPNPITSTGSVKLNLTFSDARYVNEAQANAVTSAMIADGNVTSADIRDTTVNAAELKDGAVTSAKILDATIAAADLGQMGAASGQVMKWTGSAWAARNDSIGGGSGPVRGSDIVKPCTLAAAVAGTGAVLCVDNSGAGGGLAVARAGDYGMRVWRSSYNGVTVDRAGLFGVRVDSAQAGLFVERAAANGVQVARSVGNGVRVDTADVAGFWVRSTGWEGVLVDRAGAEGIEVVRAQTHGIKVDTALTQNGVDVALGAHHGFHVDSCGWSGFAVDRAGFHGLHVGRANGHGAYVQRARKNGLYVVKADTVGALVDTATQGFRINSSQFGVVVGSASTDGISIMNTGDDGIEVGNVGYGLYCPSVRTTGVLVSEAGSNGVYANSSNGAGGFFRNNNNDNYALTAYNNAGTGSGIRGLYVQGHGYATGGWQTYLADGSPGFAVVGPRQEVMASGSARFIDGAADVAFASGFSEALADDAGLRVVVTPTGPCAGFWVSTKSARGFRVESAGATDATFDWIAFGQKASASPAPVPPRIEGLK